MPMASEREAQTINRPALPANSGPGRAVPEGKERENGRMQPTPLDECASVEETIDGQRIPKTGGYSKSSQKSNPGCVLPDSRIDDHGDDLRRDSTDSRIDAQDYSLGSEVENETFETDSGKAMADNPGGRGSNGALGAVRGGGVLGVVGGEDAISTTLRKLGAAPGFDAGKSVGIPVGKQENTLVGKSVGIPVGKQYLAQQNQQHSRTEWYRYEMDFRPLKTGYNVLIRKRLRWSDSRYSKQIIKRFCPQLTRKMVQQISVGKFSAETINALQNGGIKHGFIKALQERIGKGNGKRRTELTEFERSLLARIESSLNASNRGRDSHA